MEKSMALEIFLRQMKCVEDDDRAAQLKLYSQNLHYEFPFANDRPKVIEGLDAFEKTMNPVWQRRRDNDVQLKMDEYEFHKTDEEDLFLAVFMLRAVFADSREDVSSQCVQLLRIRDNLICEVREYFEP